MNVAEVEALGRRLQDRYATEVRDAVAQIDKLVGRTPGLWVGPDADRFRKWWPEKRSRMLAMADDLSGFGQSALNNAKEQRIASGEQPGGTEPPLPPYDPGTGNGGPPGGSGDLPGVGRTWQEVEKAYRDNYLKYGLWTDGGPNGDNRWQCVSWVWFRMRELGYEGAQIRGDGGLLAGNLGGKVGAEPQAGSIISYGSHVVFVEGVVTNADGSKTVRISEMNSGSDGSGADDASPQEYRVRNLTLSADGRWTGTGSGPVTVANLKYGKARI